MNALILDNWAFAQIPNAGSNKITIALLGYIDGIFKPGTSHVVNWDANERLATTSSGSTYILGEIDPQFNMMYKEKGEIYFKEMVRKTNNG